MVGLHNGITEKPLLRLLFEILRCEPDKFYLQVPECVFPRVQKSRKVGPGGPRRFSDSLGPGPRDRNKIDRGIVAVKLNTDENGVWMKTAFLSARRQASARSSSGHVLQIPRGISSNDYTYCFTFTSVL